MQLAKPALDVGLYTNQLDAQLRFWKQLGVVSATAEPPRLRLQLVVRDLTAQQRFYEKVL